MDWVRDFYRRTNKLDKPIVLDQNNLLVDGYIRYLVLLENNIEATEVKVLYYNQDVTYVFGKHPGRDKEYVWKMSPKATKSEIPSVGQTILVQTKYGLRTAFVTRIETLSAPPRNEKIRMALKTLDTPADMEVVFENGSRVTMLNSTTPSPECWLCAEIDGGDIDVRYVVEEK
jgi:hypothetical protein